MKKFLLFIFISTFVITNFVGFDTKLAEAAVIGTTVDTLSASYSSSTGVITVTASGDTGYFSADVCPSQGRECNADVNMAFSVYRQSDDYGYGYGPSYYVNSGGSGHWNYSGSKTICGAPAGVYVIYFWAHGGASAIPERGLSPQNASTTINVSSSPSCGGVITGSGTTSLTIYDTPDVTFQVNGAASATIAAGSSATLSWTPVNTNSGTACTATGNWAGAKSSTPGSTYTESTGALAAGSYTYNLACAGGASSTSSTKTVTLTVTPNAPTASITANGTSGSITIAYNSIATIAWSSTNATSCSISPTGWTGTSGSQSSGNLTTTTTYVQSCTGPGGNASSSVTVNVSPAPDFSVACAPPTSSINQGSTSSFSLTTTPSNGHNTAVTFSASFSPSSGTLPTVSFSNNGAVPGATTVALVNTNGSTSTGTYTITFSGTDGSLIHTCNVSLTVNSSTPPNPPTSVIASNSSPTFACGTVGVTWQPDAAHDINVTYEIYKSAAAGGPWTLLTTVAYVNGQPSYSYTDGSPNAGSNYYYVKAVKNTLSSTNAYTTPVSPLVCSVNVDFSNKDLIRVNSNTASAGPDVDNRCNGSSDIFTLPNQAVFREGDKAYFRINICNSGTQPLTGITITESASLQNLTNITFESSYTSPSGCVTNVNDTTKVYTLADIAPAVNGSASICSFVVSGTVTSGGGPAGALFRFQNVVTISSAQASKTITTPKYLFSVGSGVPSRNETAP